MSGSCYRRTVCQTRSMTFLSQIDHMEKDDLARAISRLAALLADLDSGGSRLSTCGVPIVGWQWTKVSAESARLNWRIRAGGRPVCRTPEMLAEPGTG